MVRPLLPKEGNKGYAGIETRQWLMILTWTIEHDRPRFQNIQKLESI
jgi:hypothetical protein